MSQCELEIDIDKPRYDQDTYLGRAKHFFLITNPLNLFVSAKKLEEAKCIVEKYRYSTHYHTFFGPDFFANK